MQRAKYISNGTITYKITGDPGPQGPVGPAGADGKEIELRTISGKVQWRYVGDSAWTDLFTVPTTTGREASATYNAITGEVMNKTTLSNVLKNSLVPIQKNNNNGASSQIDIIYNFKQELSIKKGEFFYFYIEAEVDTLSEEGKNISVLVYTENGGTVLGRGKFNFVSGINVLKGKITIESDMELTTKAIMYVIVPNLTTPVSCTFKNAALYKSADEIVLEDLYGNEVAEIISANELIFPKMFTSVTGESFDERLSEFGEIIRKKFSPVPLTSNPGQYTKDEVIDSTTSGKTFLFRFRYFNDLVFETGDYLFLVCKFNVNSIRVKAGASSLEGLVVNTNITIGGNTSIKKYTSVYDTGEYVLQSFMEVGTTANSNNYVGISMDQNYNNYDSVIEINNIELYKMSKNDYNAYKDIIVESIKNSGQTEVSINQLKLYGQNVNGQENYSWYKGKKLCVIGDSITQQDLYPTVLKQKLGFQEVQNCGKGGTQVGGTMTTSINNDSRINEIDSDCDVIIFMGGTNDFGNNRTLGTIDDTDVETFYGALNEVAKKLVTKFPDKIIVFATTPFGVLHKTSGFTDGGRINKIGLSTADYGECIIKVARKFGIPCADVYGKCGWNNYNITEWLKDDGAMVHTLPKGGYRIGEIIAATLREVEPSGLY